MGDLKRLEQRIAAIEARNAQVEKNKAWETSKTRRFSITILTYIIIAIFFALTGSSAPLLSALVPCLGFILSTLAVKSIRSIWEKKQ